jgi:Domain of unknown function (DUF6766)
MLRDTLENWQSEFLQLLWQVTGLAILLHVGSPHADTFLLSSDGSAASKAAAISVEGQAESSPIAAISDARIDTKRAGRRPK